MNLGKQLDYALAFVLIGSIGMSIGYITLKLLFRRDREKRVAAESTQIDRQFLPADRRIDDHVTILQELAMKKLYINPLPVRIWHWTNAFGFVLLIATGLQIRYLDLIHLVSFKTAVVVHNWVGFAMIADFFLWLGFYLFTGKIKVYYPELSPAKYLRQLQYYGYGIFRGDPDPHHLSIDHKFNPLQSITYLVVMVLIVPVQFFTGLLLWDVSRFSSIVEMFGGIRVVDSVHVIFFAFIVGFIFIHPYLASLSDTPWAHYKAMITGYEEVEDEQ